MEEAGRTNALLILFASRVRCNFPKLNPNPCKATLVGNKSISSVNIFFMEPFLTNGLYGPAGRQVKYNSLSASKCMAVGSVSALGFEFHP